SPQQYVLHNIQADKCVTPQSFILVQFFVFSFSFRLWLNRSPKVSKYGFVERVVDSISVHIKKLHLHIRTHGKMKCDSIGPWTPPVIEIILEHIKYCSTDPNGDVSCAWGKSQSHIYIYFVTRHYWLRQELSLEDCFERSAAPEGQVVIHKRLHAQTAHAYMINPHRYGQVLAEQKLQTYFTCLPKSDEKPEEGSCDANRTYRRVKLFTTA